jgi:hypothetical protein
VSSVERAPRARAPGEHAFRRFIELLVLWSFAAAQPLLDVTGRSPETFVFYRVDGLEVVAYVLLVLLAVPVALWLVVIGVSTVSRTAGRVVHAAFAGALIVLIVIQAGKALPAIRGPALVFVAVVVAVAVLVFFARSETSRRFVTYLIPAPLVFALLFLLFSPTALLVRPAGNSASAATAATGGPHPPVVMLLLDELPLRSLLDSKGEVDARVFPSFARLAKRSHWFRNGTGVNGLTQYAVPSMLTGRYPTKELAPSYVAHPDSFFSLLAPDYRIRSFESITQLCDPELCDETDPNPADAGGLRGLFDEAWKVAKDLANPNQETAPDTEQFDEESAGEKASGEAMPTTKKPADGFAKTQPNFEALGHNQPERFQQFLEGLRPSDQPTVHFLHLLLPHSSWRYLPSGMTYPFGRLLGKGWVTDSWPVEVAHQRHMLQLAYTDRLLGTLMEQMEATGLWDDALVVVTADHGNSFVPGTKGRVLETRPEVEADLAWVPVFIKEPGQSQGMTSDANWEHVDLLPTMADALGVTLPFRVDGISQLSDRRARTEKFFYNQPGDRVEFAPEDAFRIVLGGVTDALGRGSEGPAGLYVTGSHPDWIGRSVSSLTSVGVDVDGPRSKLTAQLADAVDFDAVDPSAGIVPALVWGTLSRSTDSAVLIAVNGKVAAVSEVWRNEGEPTFEGMANDELFRTGANDLALYEVDDRASPQLRPIAFRRQR